jgi:hypothetical protein
MQHNKMGCNNQPVQMKVRGKGWTREAVVRQKVTQGGGDAIRWDMTIGQQMRGNQEEKWTTGGGASQGGDGASSKQEEVVAQQQGRRGNQQG